MARSRAAVGPSRRGRARRGAGGGWRRAFAGWTSLRVREVGAARGGDPVEQLAGAAFAPPAFELAAGGGGVGGEAAAELVDGQLVGELAGGGDRERGRRLPAQLVSFEPEFGSDDEGAGFVEQPVVG